MRNKYGQILSVLKGASISLFLAGFLVFIAAVSVASLRLKLIVDAQDDIPITYPEALSLTFIGYFFNNFLPTSIGGDVVKAYYLSKKTKRKMSCFAAVFVDRVIGLATMIFMAFLALFFVGKDIIDPRVRNVIYAITLAAAFGVVFMANKKFARKFSALLRIVKPFEEKLKSAYEGIHKYRHHKFLMFQSVLISILSQLFFFISIGVFAFSIGSRIPAIDVILRLPIISLMSLLPSINGLGLREGSTVLFFGPIIGKGNAFAVSILWLLVLFMTSVLGGLVYALSPQYRVNLKEIDN